VVGSGLHQVKTRSLSGIESGSGKPGKAGLTSLAGIRPNP
jgi:hypothetical protein